MEKHFHIVCEGQTDYFVLSAVADRLGKNQHHTYASTPLYPPVGVRAGWGNLRQWCVSQATALAGATSKFRRAASLLGARPLPTAQAPATDHITAALLLNPLPCKSAVIVQIDADIAHELLSDAGIPAGMHLVLSPDDRIAICEAALDKWLGGHSAKKGISIHYCIACHAIENWILALHSEADLGIAANSKYDHISTPNAKLVALGYPKAKNKLRKSPASIYAKYGTNVATHLSIARTRSQSLDEFCKTVLAH